jgi:Zn finger protein HypA/HybF involved in hydrogenase expression
MVIKFLCPNGHQLSAPENMAGKKGKCPKCQSAFVVPTLDELAAAEAEEEAPAEQPVGAAVSAPAAAGGQTVAAQGEGSAVRPAMGSGKGLPAGEIFVFLCPNGHKLNGPPSLKGKAGQCPHCGAKFRIPADEDLEQQEDVPTGQADDEVPSGQLDEEGQGGFAFPGTEYGEEVIDAAIEEPLAPPPPGAAGLGYIFARLWEQREEMTEVEIFLTEGEIMAPDRYSEILSSSDFGVFAVQEGDGNYTVSVIPWSAVRRVGIRKVAELPGEMFS